MRTTRFAIAAVLLLGCGTGTEPEPAASCEPTATDDFALGVVLNEGVRWFRPFAPDCGTMEVETGLQGGWHVIPAVQAPKDVDPTVAGGQITWTVHDADEVAVADAALELFPSFWETLEGGNAYSGDFVIFYQDPKDLVGQTLTVTCRLEFDSNDMQEVTVRSPFLLVDEDPTTVF